jgi:hypothetical protein
MVYGLWFMVYGLWFMVYGLWFMVYGLWFMVYGLWCIVKGLGFSVDLCVCRDVQRCLPIVVPGGVDFRVTK